MIDETMCFHCDKKWVKFSEENCPKCEKPNPVYELLSKFIEQKDFMETFYGSLSLEAKKIILRILWNYFDIWSCPHFYTEEYKTKGRICTKVNKVYQKFDEMSVGWPDFCPYLQLSFSELVLTVTGLIEHSKKERQLFYAKRQEVSD